MSNEVAPLSGRTAMITGASSGIGEACARTLAANGARVILNARRAEKLEGLATRLRAEFGSEVRAAPFDIRRPAEIGGALARLPPRWRAIDVLVNNAGLARGWEKIYEGEPADWDEVIDSNLKGLLYVTRLVLPGMVKRGRGHVVNIASISGIESYANDAVYIASKAAVRALTESMKKDLLGTPVRVTAVSPGIVRTHFFNVRYRGDDDRASKVFEGFVPLDPEDVADAILFAVTRRPRVNIGEIVMTSVDQAGPITKAGKGDP